MKKRIHMQFHYHGKQKIQCFPCYFGMQKICFLEKINGLTFHKITDVISEKKIIYFKKNDNNTDTLISETRL